MKKERKASSFFIKNKKSQSLQDKRDFLSLQLGTPDNNPSKLRGIKPNCSNENSKFAKKYKFLAIFLIISILSVSFVSASLLGDIGNFFNKILEGRITGNVVSTDNFDTAIDSNKWNQSSSTRPAAIQGGKLKCVGAANDMSNSDSGVSSSGKWTLRGDFDIQVDYDSTIQPASDSGATTHITISGTTYFYNIANARFNNGNYWTYAWTSQGSNMWTNGVSITSLSSGKFRLQRVGNVLNGYQWQNNAWLKFASISNCDTTDMTVVLSVNNNIASISGKTPKVPQAYFDNFIVNSGTVINLLCTPNWVPGSWSTCVNSQQTRTVTDSLCGQPQKTETITCTVTPTCTEADWQSSISPSTCPSSGTQTKSWTKIGQCSGGISHSPTETITCNYQTPTCTTFTYSNYGECTPSGTQTRTVLTSSPSGCQGGSPEITRTCTVTPTCTDNDGGLNYIVSGSTTSNGNIQNDNCVDSYTLSEKYCSGTTILSQTKICPNGCKNGKCVINPDEAIARKNTLIFIGLYPGVANEGDITNNYADKISNNINGLGTCCNLQTSNKNIMNSYHSKGYLVSTHIGDGNSALQAARDGIDIITFDEFKWRDVAFTGSQFNSIKNEIKTINPNAKVGIVEADIDDYNIWYNEGAKPDFVGLEQYITTSGASTGGYASYNEFLSLVSVKFPNAKKQVWINDVKQIKEFVGKADYLVFFGTDSDIFTKFGSNWPSFKLVNIENEIKTIYGTTASDSLVLKSSYTPSLVYVGDKFQIKCDYGSVLSCIKANHGGTNCNFTRFSGTTAIFDCTAKNLGLINNYCNLFDSTTNSKCKAQTNQIESINVVKYSDEIKNIKSVTWYPFPTNIQSESYYTKLVEDIPNIKSRGFNTVWLVLSWKFFNPKPLSNPPVYDEVVFDRLKRVLALLEQNDMNAIIGLNYLGTGWSPEGINFSKWLQNETMYNSFETYSKEFMKRNINYSDRIYYLLFTEGTELDSKDSKAQAAMLRLRLGSLPTRLPPEIRSKIKIGYHDYTLINLNLAEGDSPIQSPNPFDFLSMHFYPFPTQSDKEIENEMKTRYNNFKGLYPNTPLIIGEFGVTVCSGAKSSEDNQWRIDSDIVKYSLSKKMGFNLWSWRALDDREFCKLPNGDDSFKPELFITNKDKSFRKTAIQIPYLLCGKSNCAPLVVCNNNNICETGETKENCASDCKCNLKSECLNLQDCVNHRCVSINCSSDSDCGTNKYSGGLLCDADKKNIMQNYTNFTCNNPGTAQSYCSNITSLKIKDSCSSTEMCLNAQCKTPTQCSDCGIFFGTGCTYNSCHGIGNCYYTPGFLTIGSACQDITEVCKTKNSCGDINSGECGNNVCGLSCGWNVSKGVCENYKEEIKGLVLYYPFEGNLNDASGKGNNGINHGATLTVGKIGQGYSFDGINDYIVSSKNLNINKNNPWSYSLWLKPGYNPTSEEFSEKCTIGMGSMLCYDSDLKIFYDENGNGKVYESYPNNNWYHVVGVYDGHNYKLYINASEGTNCFRPDLDITNTITNTPLFLGINQLDKRFFFNGVIDEVKIWNRTLSFDEVYKEYNPISSGGCTISGCPDKEICNNLTGKCKDIGIEAAYFADNFLNTVYDGFTYNNNMRLGDEIGPCEYPFADDFNFRKERFKIVINEVMLSMLSKTNYPYGYDNYSGYGCVLSYSELSPGAKDPRDSANDKVFAKNTINFSSFKNANIIDLSSSTEKEDIYIFKDEQKDSYDTTNIHSSRNGRSDNQISDVLYGAKTTAPTFKGWPWDNSGNYYGNGFYIYVDNSGQLNFNFQTQMVPKDWATSFLLLSVGILGCNCNSQEEYCNGTDYLLCEDNCVFTNKGSVAGKCSILACNNLNCPIGQECNSNGQCQNTIPPCTEADWQSSISPSTCPSSGTQTKLWNKIGQCSEGVNHNPSETISCVYTKPTCTSFTYSDYGQCTSSGTRTRSVTSSSPENCLGGNPSVTEQCNYIPPCTENNWNFSLSPLMCPLSLTQTKTWTKIGQCSEGVGHNPTETISCIIPTCTSFEYSDWEDCTPSGVQTRNVIDYYPEVCSGGNPQLSQECTYIPLCTEGDWQSSISPSTCPSSQVQTKTWIKIGNCSGGVNHAASDTISCIYQAPVCTNFTYSNYSGCVSSGTQIRQVLTSSPADCQGGNPSVTQQCTYVAPECNEDSNCADNNICTTESCNLTNHKCLRVNNTLYCEDGDLCTANDICSFGNCTKGLPKNCTDVKNCTVDSCNPSNGECLHDFVGCPCTNVSQCQSNNTCVTDYCNATISRCSVTYSDIACNDSNSNTIEDWCSSSGICRGETICNFNKVCNSNRGETCLNCVNDCGACFVITSSGTSNGVTGGYSGGVTETNISKNTSLTGKKSSTITQGSSEVEIRKKPLIKNENISEIVFILIISFIVIGIFAVIFYLIKFTNRDLKTKKIENNGVTLRGKY